MMTSDSADDFSVKLSLFMCSHSSYSRHRNSATCYQLAQSVLKIGSALTESVGQGEVGGCTTLADSAWWLLQLAIELAWSALGVPFFCFAWRLLQLSWL